MTYLIMLWYVFSLVMFASSMCNPARPQVGIFALSLIASAVVFGVMIYRRIYGKEGANG